MRGGETPDRVGIAPDPRVIKHLEKAVDAGVQVGWRVHVGASKPRTDGGAQFVPRARPGQRVTERVDGRLDGWIVRDDRVHAVGTIPLVE